jgi:hypothetical protein
MANIKSNIILPNETLENQIQQGDFVFCKATGGALDFWGIYGHDIGVVALDGGGNVCIPKNKELYLGGCYSYWQIVYRISCDDAVVEISE